MSNPPTLPTLRVGIEVELLMPTGLSRQDLAVTIADKIGGSVTLDWHVDSEPSAHKQLDVFQHLTPCFVVNDANGQTVAAFVSDITIRSGLNPKAPPHPAWTRILSDDQRILRMLGASIPPGEQNIEAISDAVAPLGLVCIQKPKAIKIVDSSDASVALIAGVPGETSRIAECISPPLEQKTDGWLDLVVGTASEMGAARPSEGATHLHYDSHVFSNPGVFQRLVWVFGESHDALREQFKTNPNCKRLGPLPEALLTLVNSAEYGSLDWEQIRQKASSVEGLTKYADVNLLHLLSSRPRLETVEFRMLPTSTDPAELQQMIRSVNTLVNTITNPRPV